MVLNGVSCIYTSVILTLQKPTNVKYVQELLQYISAMLVLASPPLGSNGVCCKWGDGTASSPDLSLTESQLHAGMERGMDQAESSVQ